jgi:hypothetical protein
MLAADESCRGGMSLGVPIRHELLERRLRCRRGGKQVPQDGVPVGRIAVVEARHRSVQVVCALGREERREETIDVGGVDRGP